MEWKHRNIDMPNHPLLGIVVKVEAVNYQRDDTPDETVDAKYPSSVTLTYADGRRIHIEGEGWEVEGISISEEESS